MQIQNVNSSRARSAQIRHVSSRTNQNLRGPVRNFQPSRNFHRLQINQVSVAASVQRHQPAAVRRRLRRINWAWRFNPIRYLVRRRINDRYPRRILIVRKHALAVRRNRNPLHHLRHRNRGNQAAFRQIEHANAPRSHISRVRPPPVGRNHQHV